MSIVLLSHFVDPKLIPGGLGVLVFFAISGFLITRLMFTELKATGTVAIRNFYIRRFFRLYPVIVTYTIIVVLADLIRQNHINWIEPISTLFYFSNYLYAYFSTIGEIGGTMPFALFWSLSVEEHFYIIFPLVFVTLALKPHHFLLVLSITCLVVLAARTATALWDPDLLSTYVFYYQSQFRADSLIAGVLLAVGCEIEVGRRFILAYLCHPVVAIMSILLIFITLLVRDPLFRETARYTLQSAAAASIIATVVFTDNLWRAQSLLNTPVMRWVGQLSYSLYVCHPLVHNIVLPDRHALPPFADAGLSIAISFVLASISYYLIERPVMRLRVRFGALSAR